MKLNAVQEAQAKTSLNQIPSIFKKIGNELGTVNLDWGGGKYDKSTNYLKTELNVENIVFDPYNRSEEETEEAWYRAMHTPIDSITCASVLNVIKSKKGRNILLNEIKAVLRAQYDIQGMYPEVYFTTYEKNGTGVADKKLPQTNMKTAAYIPEIAKVFPEFKIILKNKVIRCLPGVL